MQRITVIAHQFPDNQMIFVNTYYIIYTTGDQLIFLVISKSGGSFVHLILVSADR